MENREETILKVTEEMVRQGGYNGFSFRDIAKKVGIKSSSVHYHFPTKEDLGVAVAKYYTDRFIDSLSSPQKLVDDGIDPIKTYIAAFKLALTKDKRMCLCGMLGAEVDGLPAGVVTETQTFFKRNLAWLEQAYALNENKTVATQKAIQTLSLLEGALIASNVLNDAALFDQAAKLLAE